MIYAIVAADLNWGIGSDGQLLEHIPEDMKFFKEKTVGHPVIMGRKTWESLPKRPLTDRENIVISSTIEGGKSLEEIKDWIYNLDEDEDAYIIGGGQIYNALLHLCDKVYITRIYKAYSNVDTYFPDLDQDPRWYLIEAGDFKEYNGVLYKFLTYEQS